MNPEPTTLGELHNAVRELYHWQRIDDADNFSALLYRLFTKADSRNMARLSVAFTPEYNAFMLWQTSPDEEEFFKKWLGEEYADGKKPRT